MSFLVAQRTPEIGLRMALGAERRGVVAQMLKEGMLAAGTGVALGLVGAYLVSRAMQGMWFDVGASTLSRLWRGRARVHRLRALARDPGQARRVRRPADGAAKD